MPRTAASTPSEASTAFPRPRVLTAGHWLHRLVRVSNPVLRLLCFPYAGGGAPVFRDWGAWSAPGVDLVAVAPPGRGGRLHERPPDRLEAIVATLVRELAPMLDVPTAFFGHSLGALVAFELARELRRRGLPEPEHLFVSGARAPQRRRGEQIHRLPDEHFLERIRDLDGTPPEVIENTDLMRLLLPALRADFTVFETYRYVPEAPLATPISAYGARGDVHVSRDELDDWYRHTRGRFSVRIFEGDHFFLHDAGIDLLGAMFRELRLPEATW